MSTPNPEETLTQPSPVTPQDAESASKPAKKPRVAARKPHAKPPKRKAAKKAPTGKKASLGKKAPKDQKEPPPMARAGSKTAQVVALLKKAQGATLAELTKATGWQPHSVRGFISGTLGKKMGLKVEATKREDGQRSYSISK